MANLALHRVKLFFHRSFLQSEKTALDLGWIPIWFRFEAFQTKLRKISLSERRTLDVNNGVNLQHTWYDAYSWDVWIWCWNLSEMHSSGLMHTAARCMGLMSGGNFLYWKKERRQPRKKNEERKNLQSEETKSWAPQLLWTTPFKSCWGLSEMFALIKWDIPVDGFDGLEWVDGSFKCPDEVDSQGPTCQGAGPGEDPLSQTQTAETSLIPGGLDPDHRNQSYPWGSGPDPKALLTPRLAACCHVLDALCVGQDALPLFWG